MLIKSKQQWKCLEKAICNSCVLYRYLKLFLTSIWFWHHFHLSPSCQIRFEFRGQTSPGPGYLTRESGAEDFKIAMAGDVPQENPLKPTFSKECKGSKLGSYWVTQYIWNVINTYINFVFSHQIIITCSRFVFRYSWFHLFIYVVQFTVALLFLVHVVHRDTATIISAHHVTMGDLPTVEFLNTWPSRA